MNNVRTIIWDLDATVWLYNENEAQILCDKLQIDEVEQFKKQYYYTLGSLNQHFKDKVVTYERMEKFISGNMPVLKEYGISAGEFLESTKVEKKNVVTLNHEAVEVMKYFYEKGLINISVTDWFVDHQQYGLKSLGVHSYIQKIYGCDNDYLKCSTKKAEILSKELIKGKQEEFLMIGDSLSSDIFFANQLGIKSVWYNRKGKVNETGIIPTVEIKSLLDLKEIL